MKKLNPVEQNAIKFLNREGSYCPGVIDPGSHGMVAGEIRRVLDGLVRKKRVWSEETDDGPRYHLTAQGRADAEA